jgi:hypothetical protein
VIVLPDDILSRSVALTSMPGDSPFALVGCSLTIILPAVAAAFVLSGTGGLSFAPLLCGRRCRAVGKKPLDFLYGN